jgi:hypothetical protein
MKNLTVLNKIALVGLSYVCFIQPSVASHESLNAKSIAAKCYSAQWHRQALFSLAKRNFEIEHDSERNELALQLLNCLASPEGGIRDEIAFTGLSSWLREDKLLLGTYRTMFEKLLYDFGQKTIDDNQVYQPFVVLMLSELARVDRKHPYLTAVQRELLVVKSTQYMANITDYRGFDDIVGWRHNVAHTADLFLQLALNPEISKDQLSNILNAIGQQILPKAEHFYIYGEPKRLVMPVLYIYLRGEHTEQDWINWLQQYISPIPLLNWQQAYTSQRGLAKLHNAREFLNTMFVLIADSENTQLQILKPALIKQLSHF